MTTTRIEAFKHVYYEGCLSCVTVIYDCRFEEVVESEVGLLDNISTFFFTLS